ncbi:primosomal replication protein N [Nitrosomonas communis]|uniref:primosomal replication protein N n=1 Tax=Nitrosomonas communis TaxID=44574 RepID=UPI0026EE8123|nr:primosomal replication protein N [Nitrosomonas communis]
MCGKILKLGQLRYTPAGKTVIEFEISHNSNQIEASMPRQVACDISAVALADMADTISGMEIGCFVKLTGFLAKKNKMSTRLVLHVAHIDIINIQETGTSP